MARKKSHLTVRQHAPEPIPIRPRPKPKTGPITKAAKGKPSMATKSALQNLSIVELQELLEKKVQQERRKLPKLLSKRDALESEIEELNAEIEAIEGGSTGSSVSAKPGRRWGRPKGKKSTARAKDTAKKGTRKRSGSGGKRVTLPEALHSILSDSKAPMSPVEIAEKLTDLKHPSGKSKSLRTQISVALSKRPEFKRVGRGQYTVK